MRPQDLDQTEQTLSLVLPTLYRETMTAYPFPADSPAAELWVLNEVDSLVEINPTYRENGAPLWRTHLLVVGCTVSLQPAVERGKA